MTSHQSPKVTVVIATYNRADLLPRAVNSVLAQTYSDFELIIVDDCSTDGTDAVLQQLPDPRIHHIRHESNRGAAAARNTGIAYARGEYVAFLDDDDECTPNRLSDQVSVLDSNSEVGMVYGWIEEMNDSNGAVRVPGNVQNKHRGRAAFEAALTGVGETASMFYPCIRLSVIRQVGGFDEELETVGEDAVFVASVTQICDADYVPRVIARRHINHAHDQLSYNVSPDAYRKFMEFHHRKFSDELERRPKALAGFYASTSVGLMQVRQVAQSIAEVSKAFKLDPLYPSNFSVLLQLVRAFTWYVSPLGRFRARARDIRSLIYGRRKSREP